MPVLPEPIQNLITAFERLPGIGPKSASRLAFFLLRAPEDLSTKLADALTALQVSRPVMCPDLLQHHLGRQRDAARSAPTRGATRPCLCVVEEPLDVLALERTGGFKGATTCCTACFRRLRASARMI